ncbi:MAG: TatD family hydrolase [Endomicrobium sp.]|jgi:TatD DNase family protein|nr:TatD family hydrolase [Endomicrobium sp.]
MVIDTHVHLSDEKFDIDRNSVIDRAFNAGVEKIIEVSCETKYWNKTLEISRQKNIFASFGIHPNDAEKTSDTDYEKLELIIQQEKCIAIGEIGLDYHYNSCERNVVLQKKYFIKQLKLAVKFGKPVIIHSREANEDVIDILKSIKSIPKGVIHCFSGTLQQAEEFIALGFLLGIDGPVTYKKSDGLRKIILDTDLKNLLVETDSPYLPPQKYRGQRNEPLHVLEVLKEIASIKNISLEEASKNTTQNALKLFNLERNYE